MLLLLLRGCFRIRTKDSVRPVAAKSPKLLVTRTRRVPEALGLQLSPLQRHHQPPRGRLPPLDASVRTPSIKGLKTMTSTLLSLQFSLCRCQACLVLCPACATRVL